MSNKNTNEERILVQVSDAMIPSTEGRESEIRRLALTLLLLAIILTAAHLLPPPTLGRTDLRAYWGAGYLLRHGRPFTDVSTMAAVQQSLTGWPEANGAMMTWNPPWMVPLFIPLSLLTYETAVWAWLLLSLGLVLLSIQWTMQWAWPAGLDFPKLLLVYTLAVLFVPWLQMVAIGQIGALLLFGLIAHIRLVNRRPWLAGAALVLTTAKPHIVFLVLPLLLFDALRCGRWRVIAGFVGTIAAALALTFALRPTIIADYLQTITANQTVLLTRPSPTLPALFATWLNVEWLRFAGLIALPAAVWIWQRVPDQKRAILLAVIVSVVLAPYGYPFDFIVLLFPLVAILPSILAGPGGRWRRVLLLLVVIAGNVGAIVQQLAGGVVSAFWWFPLWIGLVFWLTRSPGSPHSGDNLPREGEIAKSNGTRRSRFPTPV